MYYHYYWQDIDTQTSQIAAEVLKNDIRFDMIVGIARGGVIPATLLSYKMNLPVCSLQWQCRDLQQKRSRHDLRKIMLESKTGILIVDDIVDSGTTLHEINDYSEIIERDHPDQWVPVTYAVCVKRAELVKPVPNIIFGTELESFTWVNFPWGE